MKALLVIDKPEKCEKCPLYAEYLCDKKARCSITYIPIDSAYANCPLKPMPKKQVYKIENGKVITEDDAILMAEVIGYNKCIDELTS